MAAETHFAVCGRRFIFFGARGAAKTENFRFARQQQQMMTDGLSDAMIYFQIMRCCKQSHCLTTGLSTILAIYFQRI
jgi:hypothetical protein